MWVHLKQWNLQSHCWRTGIRGHQRSWGRRCRWTGRCPGAPPCRPWSRHRRTEGCPAPSPPGAKGDGSGFPCRPSQQRSGLPSLSLIRLETEERERGTKKTKRSNMGYGNTDRYRKTRRLLVWKVISALQGSNAAAVWLDANTACQHAYNDNANMLMCSIVLLETYKKKKKKNKYKMLEHATKYTLAAVNVAGRTAAVKYMCGKHGPLIRAINDYLSLSIHPAVIFTNDQKCYNQPTAQTQQILKLGLGNVW